MGATYQTRQNIFQNVSLDVSVCLSLSEKYFQVAFWRIRDVPKIFFRLSQSVSVCLKNIFQHTNVPAAQRVKNHPRRTKPSIDAGLWIWALHL
jgi:hypothetical protein